MSLGPPGLHGAEALSLTSGLGAKSPKAAVIPRHPDPHGTIGVGRAPFPSSGVYLGWLWGKYPSGEMWHPIYLCPPLRRGS